MRAPCRRAGPLVVALVVLAGAAGAQVPTLPKVGPLQLQGQAGTSVEVYDVSGRAAQRPGQSARLFFDGSVVLFGSVTVGINLLASTEGSSTVGNFSAPRRQQLSQIGLTPQWSWGRAYLGSFADAYSPLTWSGTQVQGAGVAVAPGPLRLAAFGGRTQRAVSAGATYGAYNRTMFGGRVGIGSRATERRAASFVDLVFMRARDDASSLPVVTDTVTEEPPDLFSDSLRAPPVNRFAVTPEENVVVATVGSLALLQGKLVVRGEVGGAVHTRDTRASELDDETLGRFPSIARSLITPRVGTSGDFAYTTEVELKLDRLPGATARSPRSLELGAEYRYVGPGYVSLGAPSLLGDQRAVELRSRLRFRSWSLGVLGSRQHDNLAGQKLATTARSRMTGTFSWRASRRLTSTVRAAFLTMGNDAAEPDRRIDYTNWIAETSQMINLSRRGFFRRAGLRYSFRASGDASELRSASKLVAHSVSVQAVLVPTEHLTLTPSVGIVESRSGDGGWRTRATYELAARQALMDGRLAASASVSRAALEHASAMRASLRASLRLTERNDVVVGLRTSHVNSSIDEIADSREQNITLEVRHRL